MDKGFFITIEGPDGAGKSTHVEFLETWLQDRNYDVVTTREPGGTRLGESLRDILLNPDGMVVELSDECELMLMFAARLQHLHEIIFPAINQGQFVICDRFTDATYAYQGGGRGINENRIRQLEDWVQQGFQPDLTILFDVPVPIGLERTKIRGGRGDRFEQQKIQFKESVRQVYLQRAAKFPERITLIDATGTVKEVQVTLIQCVEEFLKKREYPVAT
jgi:dTMP kinase